MWEALSERRQTADLFIPFGERNAFLAVLSCFRDEFDRQECLSLPPFAAEIAEDQNS
jgi:hypothetical protein